MSLATVLLLSAVTVTPNSSGFWGPLIFAFLHNPSGSQIYFPDPSFPHATPCLEPGASLAPWSVRPPLPSTCLSGFLTLGKLLNFCDLNFLVCERRWLDQVISKSFLQFFCCTLKTFLISLPHPNSHKPQASRSPHPPSLP